MAVALTEAVYRDTILRSLGSDEITAANVEALWAIQAVRTADRYLCYLRTFNAAIDLLIGTLAKQNLSMEGDDPRGTGARSQRDARRIELLALRQSIQSDLDAAAEGSVGLLPATGVMTTTAPIMSPSGYPDANAEGYAGSPNPPWTTRRIVP